MIDAVGGGARAAVAIFLALAGLLKLYRPILAADALGRVIRIRPLLSKGLVILLGITEVTASIFFFTSKSWLTSVVVAALLSIFLAFLVVLHVRAPDTPCGCLGDLTVSSHLAGIVRNLALLLFLIFSMTTGVGDLGVEQVAIGIQLSLLLVITTDGISIVRRLHTESGL